jgi:putative phosphoesterase
MKLGIIADTHDNVPMVEKAVEFFNDAEVDVVVHAGDYVSPFSLKPFFSLESDFLGVWGNNDGDKIALQKMAQGKIENSPCIETYDQKKILIGHHFETLEVLIASQEFYLIIYGHTHKAEIRNEGKTLVVNPGECGGWVEGKSTIAVADLETQKAEIIELTL